MGAAIFEGAKVQAVQQASVAQFHLIALFHSIKMRSQHSLLLTRLYEML
jgi:hypothetical protein